MRWFLRRSIKGGICTSFWQDYSPTIAENVFEIISSELVVNGKSCEIIEACFNYVSIQKE